MKKKILLIIMIIGLLLLVGCAKKISDVKSDDNVGKKVTVKGIVENSIKIGQISGYTIKDDTGTIFISSADLPEEGSKKTVSGTLMKEILLGYYIKVN